MPSAQYERFYGDSRQILNSIESRPMGPYTRKVQHGETNGLLFYRRLQTVNAAILGHLDPAGRVAEIYLTGPRILGPGKYPPETLLGPERVKHQIDTINLAVTYDEGMALSAAQEEIRPEDFPSVNTWISEFVLNFSLNPVSAFKEMRAEGILNTVPFPGRESGIPFQAPEFTKSGLPLNLQNLALIRSALDAMKRKLGI